MKFDISFIVDNENYGKITTDGNEQIAMPENPQKDGYVFKGWYWDKGIWEKPFTANSLMDAPLSSDLSVYAYFVLEGESDAQDNNTVTLTFDTMGGSNVKSQILNKGATSIKPAAPEKEGYYFSGWYTYPDYENEFSFDKPLTSSTTVYAKWTQISGTQLLVNDYQDSVSAVKDVSFHDILRDETTGKYYVVYKIGEVRNLIVYRASDIEYNSGGQSITWEKSTGWENGFSESIEKSVSVAVTKSYEVETSATTSAGIELGVSGLGTVSASKSYTSSASQGYSVTHESSSSYSYSRTKSYLEQISSGGSVDLDYYESGRYYAMFVVANQNVYQYFVYDENGRLENTAIATSTISTINRVLSSPDGVFDYNNISKLDPMDEPDFSMIFNAGTGTTSDPYCIENPTQFFAAGFCPDANYKLIKDIDLFKYKVWNPIGVSTERPFSGIFDGNGKTVKNLKLAYDGKALSDEKVYGLFGYVTGSIKNLNISGISIETKANHNGKGWIRAGALCAKNSGVITNVVVTDCHLTIRRYMASTGIVAGYTDGSIDNSEVKKSSINSNGDGGLITGYLTDGELYANAVSDCELKYYAEKENRSNGGIVGYAQSSTLKNCSVTNITLYFTGSSENMHTRFLGGCTGCYLKPKMGYIAGACIQCEIEPETLVMNNVKRQCSYPDSNNIGNKNASESSHWFRKYDGKIGRVE
ncbi:MAG: InlB B-repeat-containing protein [Clostridia bacterium]|nr:InlB B-repeat-containing protein [Clostridia bacterium]